MLGVFLLQINNWPAVVYLEPFDFLQSADHQISIADPPLTQHALTNCSQACCSSEILADGFPRLSLSGMRGIWPAARNVLSEEQVGPAYPADRLLAKRDRCSWLWIEL